MLAPGIIGRMLRIDIAKTPEKTVIAEACKTLAAGGLVIFPTETVYGAGVDATNQAAVDKLLAYKSRREGKPLSIAVTDMTMAEEFVELNDQARALYAQFMPGPVTIVSKDKGKLAAGVASEFGTVGTRIADYDLVRGMVCAYQRPITATSANASGKKRPYSVDDILNNLSEKQKSQIDLILDAGTLPPNEPSTVIDTTLSAPVTLRTGNLQITPKGDTTKLTSDSETETKHIASRYILKHWNKLHKSGLIFGLDGPLGAGKTIFAKGVAEFLGITETITSPTYSYIEEYDYTRHQTSGKFYHLDLWKVETPDEYQRLEIAELLKANNILVIEWFSQVQAELETDAAIHNTPIVHIAITETDNHTRQLAISELEPTA